MSCGCSSTRTAASSARLSQPLVRLTRIADLRKACSRTMRAASSRSRPRGSGHPDLNVVPFVDDDLTFHGADHEDDGSPDTASSPGCSAMATCAVVVHMYAPLIRPGASHVQGQQQEVVLVLARGPRSYDRSPRCPYVERWLAATTSRSANLGCCRAAAARALSVTTSVGVSVSVMRRGGRRAIAGSAQELRPSGSAMTTRLASPWPMSMQSRRGDRRSNFLFLITVDG